MIGRDWGVPQEDTAQSSSFLIVAWILCPTCVRFYAPTGKAMSAVTIAIPPINTERINRLGRPALAAVFQAGGGWGIIVLHGR